jgi:homoserine dehydrogenase
MTPPLKLGIAGLGTVGTGLVRLLRQNREQLSDIATRPIEITAISARSRGKARGVSLEGATWFDDAVAMAVDPGIDVLVELIGGDTGVAREAVEAALKAGKHVVTANKALLARHGFELAKLADKGNLAINFEAAVAGGIPIIKTLRESLAGNQIKRVYGILNGTSNFILTRMQAEKRSFADALNEAQALGYAEADPTFDIDGHDSAHKLALLTSLAFGTRVALDQVHIEGIRGITQSDIEAADELYYRIKLLGVALLTESGIEQRVHPALVPKDSAIGEVSGVTNCVAVDGDFAGTLLLVGAGAGANPTASSVASDIIDIARGSRVPVFGAPSGKLKAYKRAKLGQHQGAYYVRLSVFDRPGALAKIAGRMGERDISLESIVQRRPPDAQIGIAAKPAPGIETPVIMITHETTEQAIRTALDAIYKDGTVSEKPQMIRIEAL